MVDIFLIPQIQPVTFADHEFFITMIIRPYINKKYHNVMKLKKIY
jgi:hypothetical protein